MASFWWRNSTQSKGLHWRSWDQLSKPKEVGGLGFKDIEAFNLALLGKQLWRMITRPQSLLAHIFKARYFVKAHPLEVELGSRPSFAWKSIHASQSLIKLGVRKVIGNGKETRVWLDQWLGCKPARPVMATNQIDQSLTYLLRDDLRASELMESGGREWKEDLLFLLFPAPEKSLIEGIRPGSQNCQDCYAWDYSRSGQYSVKSGYWVMINVLEPLKQEQHKVNQPSLDSLYQQLWKIDSSPKVLHFLWRALSNCLPVAGTLHYRHLARDPSCLRCFDVEESVNHLLFSCPLARLVWALSPIPAPPGGEFSESLYCNMHTIFSLPSGGPNDYSMLSLASWLLWRLWKNRNELFFKGREFTAQDIIWKAQEDAQEWSKRPQKTENKLPMVTEKEQVLKWTPPPQNWLKCNVDGTWMANGSQGGIGWILRDSRGKMIWMGAKAVPHTGNVIQTEAEAMRWAILQVLSFGYERVIFESDCQSLVHAITKDQEWPSLQPVTQDMRNLLSHFKDVSVAFCKREKNCVADRIAKETLSFSSYVPKLYSVLPGWVRPLVHNDVV